MLFLQEYIDQFEKEGTDVRRRLARRLAQTKSAFDVFAGKQPLDGFEGFVDTYNWLGQPETKQKYQISQNLARNLPGALMQDFLLHLVISLCKRYPALEVFTEVRVPFGTYPLWEHGEVRFDSPSELADLAVGYLVEDGTLRRRDDPWPKQPYYRLAANQHVLPLVTANSKIRVSQGEFFDWLGRDQLMTKGNPHCLSVQVALRKEMDLSIVEASQAGEKFFLIGEGGEGGVEPRRRELDRLVHVLNEHLDERMAPPE